MVELIKIAAAAAAEAAARTLWKQRQIFRLPICAFCGKEGKEGLGGWGVRLCCANSIDIKRGTTADEKKRRRRYLLGGCLSG